MESKKIKISAKVVPPGTVVIGAKIIDRLLVDKQAKALFGFLANPPQRTYAACCGKTKKRVDYEAIKTTIAQLDAAALNQLKQLIGAKHIQIWYRRGAQTLKKVG